MNNPADKSQAVRALDVLVVGPFMLYASQRLRGPAGPLMLLLGVLTIAYNGANYLSNVTVDETRMP
jgi:hypothetical protein